MEGEYGFTNAKKRGVGQAVESNFLVFHPGIPVDFRHVAIHRVWGPQGRRPGTRGAGKVYFTEPELSVMLPPPKVSMAHAPVKVSDVSTQKLVSQVPLVPLPFGQVMLSVPAVLTTDGSAVKPVVVVPPPSVSLHHPSKRRPPDPGGRCGGYLWSA